ncbi:MAG: pyruvate, phosphate dikinase [Candidatus Hydrogenedentes bacterium]|nr:pyruvate, phosphate dikinase [Candidatus Hydrogenedentota bacterium]
MSKKYVYLFAPGKAEGRASMKEILGGKGANLAEMANLGFPVPAGFTISTEMCTIYYANKGKLPETLKDEVAKAIQKVEKIMGRKFGDPQNPLLVSVRSGARVSMPGMMETVLNVGLCSKTIPGLIEKTKNERFVYDSYRRLIMMYSDVVMEKAAGIEPPKEEDGIRKKLEKAMDEMKKSKGVKYDTELDAEDLKKLCELFKEIVRENLGKQFPDDPNEQLWGAIKAVFQSWNGKRAVSYRRIEKIPDDWGTAVNVQAMVFGNMGEHSATGVAFTRNPSTGENVFYGEWLINAQGEDVVAGIRTPFPLNKYSKNEDNKNLPSLEEYMPQVYKELVSIRNKLEKHFRDMQDIEFTIEEGKLYMLQTRTGKRTGIAAVRIAVEMLKERLIDKKTAILRVKPSQLDEFLHPMLDPKEEQKAKPIASGLPAGPGGAVGQVVFTADDAEAWAKEGKKVILVRDETSPEDVHGMHVAEAILTAVGGMTSHAALVARGWGKCCIVGCKALQIDFEKKEARVAKQNPDGSEEIIVIREGDWVSLNGTEGKVYLGQLPVIPPDPLKNKWFITITKWAEEFRQIGVRTNAERPEDAAKALEFGAEGIGLARTEHMFFQPERIIHMREMILAKNKEERRKAVMKLLPFQKEDFIAIFKVMKGKPVTIRLLDPPLHEFVGTLLEDQDELEKLAKLCNVKVEEIKARVQDLHELNPMLGHRGCRLGITYPEITEMQARAIFEAAATLIKQKVKVLPEIMVPLVGTKSELDNQVEIIHKVAKEVIEQEKVKINYLVGTMIEVPRAALTGDQIAETAEFFSFGTNDLTQMTYGFSRDDVGSFLPYYLENKILPHDPFEVLDQEGVGQLVKMAVEKGRATRPTLKCGIWGELGGEPSSVKFCHKIGLDYVSCSPYRVPIAKFAASQAAIENPRPKFSAKSKTASKKSKK